MSRIILAATLALAALFPAVSAQAQNGTLTRSFVSSSGVDTNPCTITQPCATFAHAYTAIGANGIIAALDPGKYGPITITGPVTINGNGWAAITGPSSGVAITINAVSGNVTLIGLEIDGAGAADTGILFNSGSRLNIRDSAIQNFVFDGIKFAPTGASDLFVSNARTANNGGDGIFVNWGGTGNVSAVFNRVEAVDNQGTANFYIVGSPNGTLNAVIVDSVASGDQSPNGAGFFLNTGGSLTGTTLEVLRSVATSNTFGFYLEAGTFYIANSMITGNTLGWQNSYQEDPPPELRRQLHRWKWRPARSATKNFDEVASAVLQFWRA
jgi:hypothetical protein